MELSEPVCVGAVHKVVQLPQSSQFGEDGSWDLAEQVPEQWPVFDGLKHFRKFHVLCVG